MPARTSSAGRRWLLVGLTLVVASTVSAGAVPPTAPPGAPSHPPDLGVPDPQLARLFTPGTAPPGSYEVYRSSRAIAQLAASLRALDPDPVEDAWKVMRLAPADAFGSIAPYDAPRLARLYLGALPLVARGSLHLDEGVVGYTLIAPWPDASLSALQPGTMVIVVHVTRLTGLR